MIKDKNINEIKIAPTTSEREKAELGRICWFTICELLAPVDDVYALLIRHGIPREYYPKKPRPVDCFKKAIQKISVKPQNYMITEERIIDGCSIKVNTHTRLLVSKGIGEEEKALPVVGKWTYSENDETIIPTLINKAHEKEFVDLTNALLNTFYTLKNHYDEKNIRDMLRNILKKTYAISMKENGSIYFINRQYENILLGVANVINSLKSYKITRPSEMVTIPVKDTEEQRKLVCFKFEEEIISGINDMLAEIIQLKNEANLKITTSDYKKYAEKVKYYKEMTEKYKQYIEITSEKVEIQLDVLQKQVIKLSESIEDRDIESDKHIYTIELGDIHAH